MNTILDMGGTDGYGPVIVEDNEPVFHAEWERRAVAVHLAMAMGGAWISDECRSSIERMEPVRYLTTSYYERWVHFISELLIAKGVITQEELAMGHSVSDPGAASFIKKVEPGTALEIFRKGGSIAMPTGRLAQFSKGEKVRARNIHPLTHTRLPRYVRGKVGTVRKNLGSFGFADTRAHGLGDHPQHIYSVEFDGRELWGPEGGQADTIILDLYEDYLEAAQ